MQVSSGVWIATQSGSTGAISSAGGEVMDFGDNRMQFHVTSPYKRGGNACTLSHGYSAEPLKFVSRSPNNAVYLDGPTLSYRLDFGSVLEVGLAPVPLEVYGYGRSRAGRDG